MQILIGGKKERGRLPRAGEQRLCEELEAGESRGCGQVPREAGETVEQWSEVRSGWGKVRKPGHSDLVAS